MIEKIKRNPVVVATVVVAVLLTAQKVFLEGMPLTEVLSEEYVTGVLLAASAIVSRALVFAKPTVEAKVERALADASRDRTEAANER